MSTEVKEKPILFSGPMVRAILDGKKTQTRRVVKISQMFFDGDESGCGYEVDLSKCPYGSVGDRLWVRESFRLGTCPNDTQGMAVYQDDTSKLSPSSPVGSEGFCRQWKSVPSIHMPRWASRITLEITAIRVERLQDISAKDAVAEGINMVPGEGYHTEPPLPYPVATFKRLWNTINGSKHPWESNPYVWIVEFKRVEETA